MIVPVVGIAAYLAVAGRVRQALREAEVGWGVLLFVAVAGPWYAAMVWIHGPDYLARARGETLGRVFRAVTGPGGGVSSRVMTSGSGPPAFCSTMAK